MYSILQPSLREIPLVGGCGVEGGHVMVEKGHVMLEEVM